MNLYSGLLRPLAFRFDPEWVHEQAMGAIERGLISVGVPDDPRLVTTVAGIKFPNPIGLAAGFDKNAVAVNHWHRLGFGFAELGTITPRPQSGNPRPRLFRLPEDKALINRMGFNNDGAEAIAARIEASFPKIPLGVNLGKNKDTEAADAASDYAKSFERLKDLGDYFVINVSSPNTPGLRSLQEKGPLLEIVDAMRGVHATKPIFIKVAPDLELEAVDDVIEVVNARKLQGVIATNTTLDRTGLKDDPNQAGGLSGAPVRTKSNLILRHLRENCDPTTSLIGVGGIFTAADAIEKFRLGADLVQLYTGWIYGGPALIPQMLTEIVGEMDRVGLKSIRDFRSIS